MMKRLLISLLFLAASPALYPAGDGAAGAIDLRRLLEEMLDRSRIAEFPQPEFVCKQASSYNRRSTTPGTPDWFAGADFDQFYGCDEEAFPSHFGTGSEDYFGYAFNSTSPFDAPFHAQPSGKGNWGIGHTTNVRDRIHDRIPFNARFKFDMELFHWQPKRKVDYATTTHWYAFNGATDNGQNAPEKVREKVAQPWVGPDDTPREGAP